MANFETALAGMRRGEKWRRGEWSPGWIFIDERLFMDDDGDEYAFGDVDLLATDWERYEEPKRSLSFKEACKCSAVKIYLPKGQACTYAAYSGVWGIEALSSFDFAERRDYKMEDISDV